MQVVRRAARAILIDDAGGLIVFKRTVPKRKVYWSTPGGGVDAEDGSVEAALHRELFEELGATVDRAQQVFLTSPPRGDGIAVQHFFVCHLVTMDIRNRTGSEFSNPAKGRYDVERFDLRAKKPKLARVNLQPREARDFILDNRAALLGAVLDGDTPPLMEPPPVPDPVVVEVVRVERIPAKPGDGMADGTSPTTTARRTAAGRDATAPDDADATWSDADDAAARDDHDTWLPIGVGGRHPADSTAPVVAPTPLGAGLLPDPSASTTPLRLPGHDETTAQAATDPALVPVDAESSRSDAAPPDATPPHATPPDVDAEPDLDTARLPWFRRLFRHR